MRESWLERLGSQSQPVSRTGFHGDRVICIPSLGEGGSQNVVSGAENLELRRRDISLPAAGAGRPVRRAGAARRPGSRALGPPAHAARPAGLERAEDLSGALGPYTLQAAIAAEAREEFERAADLCANDRERDLLLSG